MKIEKICEYFNDIGILQLENINSFLQIYTQISQNKYKNKSDKLILALFSYITLASKSEQQIYDICKNIVNCFLNNLILYRYRALTMFNNIFKNKLHSKYIFFLSKLNTFIYNKKRKTNKYIHLNQNSKINISNDQKELHSFDMANEENNDINKSSIEKNNNIRLNPNPRRNIMTNKKDRKFNNYRDLYKISDDNKECTFSPEINRNYRPNYKIKANNINYNLDFLSSYNYNKDNNDNSLNNKYGRFKNSINYGYNNKINHEIEKMLSNISKYSNNPNNSKYLPIKTKYRKQINNIYPSYSYNEFPSFLNINYSNYNNIDDNNAEYHYYDEDYDFYENEKDHVKKVQDKILQLKLKNLEKISKECTFSPEINPIPKYLNLNNIYNKNNLTEYNTSHRDYLNNNNIINNSPNINYHSKNISKNRDNKINEEYADDYYNIYPKQLSTKKKRRPRSYSGSKNDNEYSIYKARKEELSKLFKEQYPFMPNVKFNKNIQIKSTFDERQKKLIKDKEKLYKQKEEEEKKYIEEKRKNRTKTDNKEVVKRLYDNEATKIKERLKKEKEEKSKKKNVIDWSKKRKKYNQLYPEDFKNKRFNKNNINVAKEKDDNVVDFNSFANNSKEKRNINNNDDNLNGNEGKNIIDFSTFSKDKNSEKSKENNNKTIKNEGIKDNNVDSKLFNKSKKEKNIYNKTKCNKNISNIEKMKQKEKKKHKIMLMDKIKDEHVIGFKNNISNNNSNYNIMNNNSISNLNIDEFEINKAKVNENNNSNNNLKDYQSSLSINLEERKKKFEKNNNLLDNMNIKGDIKSTTFQEIMNRKHNK